MPPPIVTLRAMTRFQCLAEACEDTCCSGLRVPVDEAWTARTTALVHGTGFAEAATTAGRAGFIEMKSDGSCPFLGAQKLCGLQKSFGPPALPSICASFPRTSWSTPVRTQLSGTLACPEMARLVLLDEHALDPVEASLTEAQQYPAPSTGSADAQRVHDSLASVFERRALSLKARLVIAARLGFALDAAGDAKDEVLTHFARAEVIEAIASQADQLSVASEPILQMLASLLRARRLDSRGPRFDALADSVAKVATDPGVFQKRRTAAEETFGELITRAFDNAARHHFSRNAVFSERSAGAYVLRLAFKLALVRTLFVGHPDLAEAIDAGDLASGSAALVAAFQISARHLEQAPSYNALLGDLGSGAPEETLGRALIFSAF